jgi:subtilisin family serine protease
MNDPNLTRITEPLRELATRAPEERFNVIVRVVVPTSADPKVAYVGVPAILQQVAAAISALDLDPSIHEGVTSTGAQAGSPFLYAVLTGAHVLALDRQLPVDVPIEFRRDQTALDQTSDFNPGNLLTRIIAEPLASKIKADPDDFFDVIVVLSTGNPQGPQAARKTVTGYFDMLAKRAGDVLSGEAGEVLSGPAAGVPSGPAGDVPSPSSEAKIEYQANDDASHPYVFATLAGTQIRALIELDRSPATGPVAIHQIWEDSHVQALITKSIATVKADAAHVAYSAAGKDIVWAVLDSGIDATHPHFDAAGNLKLDKLRPLRHRDFSGTAPPNADPAKDDPGALIDAFGHGTHVAGILAGSWKAAPGSPGPAILRTSRDGAGADERVLEYPDVITGMAPQCKLVSLRVLDDRGGGQVSSIIDAFEEIQRLNGYGRNIVVAGVNLSVGYPFDAKWFGCGQSPLCIEVNRLVRSGVVVVTAAGNSGYGTLTTAFTKGWAATLPQTINDPGNADLAITVGSTHREQPHLYGVSYFSSKGPTGDGRLKPDLVAPGERIISCASAQSRLPATISDPDSGKTTTIPRDGYYYKEDSGTSMAAPHVSGLIASFLSIRREYIGQPESVKALFVENATDLRRDRDFQGSGLVDIMRVIQAV